MSPPLNPLIVEVLDRDFWHTISHFHLKVLGWKDMERRTGRGQNAISSHQFVRPLPKKHDQRELRLLLTVSGARMLAQTSDLESAYNSRNTKMKVFENVTVGADHLRTTIGRDSSERKSRRVFISIALVSSVWYMLHVSVVLAWEGSVSANTIP